VTPGYFRTLGLPIRAGRDFTADDLARSGHHVVISEGLARVLFGADDPIGRRLTDSADAAAPDWHEIVGVVGDVRHSSLTEPPAPRVYDLLGEHWARTLYLVARTHGDAVTLAPIVRREVAAIDRTVPVFEVRTLEDLVGAASAARRAATIFASGLAAVSLLLAAIGVYGVLASSVAARAREIGVRRALGASAGGIVALVAREVIVMSAAGIAAGLAIAAVSARAMQTQLYGMAASDLRVAAGVAALLMAIAALAGVVPSRRAVRIDPAVTLRTE
jgi:putative ABC transport system permease protein